MQEQIRAILREINISLSLFLLLIYTGNIGINLLPAFGALADSSVEFKRVCLKRDAQKISSTEAVINLATFISSEDQEEERDAGIAIKFCSSKDVHQANKISLPSESNFEVYFIQPYLQRAITTHGERLPRPPRHSTLSV